jgi:hypothetical protein
VRDAGEETFVTHNWYYGDELKATVKLKVAGEHWRTWSSKWIHPTWKGTWRVEIKDAKGRTLSSISFTIGAKPDETGEDS